MVYKREKCACKACQDGVSVAPVPDKLIEKGLPGVGLITEILVNKYKDHLPVYRMHQRFKRMGIDIPQSTMTGWIGQITPEILKLIFYSRAVKSIQKPSKINGRVFKKSKMWCQCS